MIPHVQRFLYGPAVVWRTSAKNIMGLLKFHPWYSWPVVAHKEKDVCVLGIVKGPIVGSQNRHSRSGKSTRGEKSREPGTPVGRREFSIDPEANFKRHKRWVTRWGGGRTFVDEQPQRMRMPWFKRRGVKCERHALMCSQKDGCAKFPFAARMAYNRSDIDFGRPMALAFVCENG